jgi:hypothetical protein
MAGTLEERYGVSISGTFWDVGAFKLWEGQSQDVILFSPAQPTLRKNLTTGRYEAACTTYRAQRDGTYKIVGGGGAFTLVTAIELEDGELQALKDQWRDFLVGEGSTVKNPIFVPLNTRKGTTEMAIPTIAGQVSPLTDKINDAGTAGGTISYMVDLTPAGAQEWSEAFSAGKAPTGQVVLTFEYMRYLPNCSVDIWLHGDRVFQHFSAHLNSSVNFAGYYGASLDIKAQFQSLRAEGAIEMTFTGLDDLPGGMEKIKENVTNTIIDQGLKAMLGLLFKPAPDVKPAEAGTTHGAFGGTNLALKWQRAEDAVDLRSTLRFGGFTWLTERADVDLSVLAGLDDSYVTPVNTELQFPATITVAGDPQVSQTAISWDASEGQAPQSPVLPTNGGTQTYIVTSKTPDQVKIDYTAKINYQDSHWPIVTTHGQGTVKDGLDNVLIKPSSWIGSVSIYLYVKDASGKGLKLIGAQQKSGDYLVVNVSYTSPNLPQPIKASTRLTLDGPVTFNFPIDPNGAPGNATFSAFGIIEGKLVQAPEQKLRLDEQAVFVLVGGTPPVQLVSADAIISEDDNLAKDLLTRRDGVQVTGDAAKTAETTKSSSTHVAGTLHSVEYAADGTALLVDTYGMRRRVLLPRRDLPSLLSLGSHVDLSLDQQGKVEAATVELSAM